MEDNWVTLWKTTGMLVWKTNGLQYGKQLGCPCERQLGYGMEDSWDAVWETNGILVRKTTGLQYGRQLTKFFFTNLPHARWSGSLSRSQKSPSLNPTLGAEQLEYQSLKVIRVLILENTLEFLAITITIRGVKRIACTWSQF